MATRKKVAPMGSVSGGIDPLAPQVTPHEPKLTNEELVTFDFAVNVEKVNRAKAWVNVNAETLGNPKGKDLVEAVKERYLALGGLLRNQEIAGKAPAKKTK